MNGKMLYKKVAAETSFTFLYTVLHFITFILQPKRFLPFPRKGSLYIHGLVLNKHVLTRDLGELVWDVT